MRFTEEIQVFYASLLRLLDDKALTVIFANVEDILLANTAFLSSLEQRQKACRLYVDMVGDLLEEHMPAMEIYTVCPFGWIQNPVLFRPFGLKGSSGPTRYQRAPRCCV